MKIDVTEYEKKYTLELAPITQLCGQNIQGKPTFWNLSEDILVPISIRKNRINGEIMLKLITN